MTFLKYPQPTASANSFTIRQLCALLLAMILTACTKPVEKTEDIRPVRVLKLAADQVDALAEFPGDVRARVESKLGFRVGGKIVSRKVNLGDVVKRGQILMQLDPQDLRLAQVQANAGLDAARSNHDLAQAELKRYQELRDKNFVSQAVLDGKLSTYQAAKATYDQAIANYKGQKNQTGYATLIADIEGVVTGVDAEVGQVVAAGSPVVRVAQTADKDVVIAIPENQVDTLSKVSDIRVRIWANPTDVIAGKLRELSPVADAATRTYTAKIAIPSASPDILLGMTAYVTFAEKSTRTMIRVPLSALLQDHGGSAVWVVEGGMVRLVPVQIAGPSGDAILLAGGVSVGQTVVTAGVNSLKPGQKVRILGDDPILQAPAAASGQTTASGAPAATPTPATPAIPVTPVTAAAPSTPAAAPPAAAGVSK